MTTTSASTRVEQLAEFVTGAEFDQLSDDAREQLKLRVLDSLGCALGALEGEPVKMIAEQNQEFGGEPLSAQIDAGRTAPDRAALYNGALVRYLDFNDSYLAPGETCHPSDNLAPVLAACDYAQADGRTLMTALAVAYQVQTRLSDVAPVRAKGFDHTTQGAYAVAAGVSRALGLDRDHTANAVSIAGTSLNSLRVTRTGSLSHWKGLAYPATAFGATHAAFLAKRGITGPREVFEGNKGFMDAISDQFEIDWSKEDLESVTRTILKKFNAEIHSQSAIEALIELQKENDVKPGQVERIELDTFQVAFDIIGGGEEGSKYEIQTKEEADHSLPYLLAVALLDGQVLPDQYRPERIASDDVQGLLHRVEIKPDDSLSERFPQEHSARIRLHLRDGQVLEREQRDYEGFHTRPMAWDTVAEKFDRLACARVDDGRRSQIKDAVAGLEEIDTRQLTDMLEVLDEHH
jgi:2-methylcitrate dehydratase